jgi:hypothetical protein
MKTSADFSSKPKKVRSKPVDAHPIINRLPRPPVPGFTRQELPSKVSETRKDPFGPR